MSKENNSFNSSGPVYAFTNEALSQYMKNYDFNGKSVLASLGSGDFVLNAYLMGAEKVDSFDINLVAYYFYQLKRAIIIKYDFETFCSFIRSPKLIFVKFQEYKHLLDSECVVFFENLIKIYSNDLTTLLNKLFIDKVGTPKTQYNESNTFDTTMELLLVSQYKNPYLQSKENYDLLKQRLMNKENDEFYFEELYNLNPKDKYDIVYLSNIGDYERSEQGFKDFVERLKEKVLNENGIIIIVSITNHIVMIGEDCEWTRMDSNEIKKFNKDNEGVAELPIMNLGIQNVYTTYPYKSKKLEL